MNLRNFLGVAWVALFATALAPGGVIGTTGQVSIIAPPADVRLGSFESDTVAPIFAEHQNVLLGSALTVNFTAPGTYNTPPAANGTISGGTFVSSYYLINDPVGSDTANTRTYTGSVTFDTDILGVIVLDPEFASSNGILGHVGTLYSASGIQLELGGPDAFTISANRRVLSFDMTSNTAADNIRIVTAAAPEPTTWITMLVGVGIFGVARCLRRRSGRFDPDPLPEGFERLCQRSR